MTGNLVRFKKRKLFNKIKVDVKAPISIDFAYYKKVICLDDWPFKQPILYLRLLQGGENKIYF